MKLDAQPRDLRSTHPRNKNTWNLIILIHRSRFEVTSAERGPEVNGKALFRSTTLVLFHDARYTGHQDGLERIEKHKFLQCNN